MYISKRNRWKPDYSSRHDLNPSRREILEMSGKLLTFSTVSPLLWSLFSEQKAMAEGNRPRGLYAGIHLSGGAIFGTSFVPHVANGQPIPSGLLPNHGVASNALSTGTMLTQYGAPMFWKDGNGNVVAPFADGFHTAVTRSTKPGLNAKWAMVAAASGNDNTAGCQSGIAPGIGMMLERGGFTTISAQGAGLTNSDSLNGTAPIFANSRFAKLAIQDTGALSALGEFDPGMPGTDARKRTFAQFLNTEVTRRLANLGANDHENEFKNTQIAATADMMTRIDPLPELTPAALNPVNASAGVRAVLQITDQNTFNNDPLRLIKTLIYVACRGVFPCICLSLGGYDMHGNRHDEGDRKDRFAGEICGMLVGVAHELDMPLLLDVGSDGSLSPTGRVGFIPATEDSARWSGDYTPNGGKALCAVTPTTGTPVFNTFGHSVGGYTFDNAQINMAKVTANTRLASAMTFLMVGDMFGTNVAPGILATSGIDAQTIAKLELEKPFKKV